MSILFNMELQPRHVELPTFEEIRAFISYKEKNLPLYLKNEDNSGTISFIQKPEGWEHHWG